MKRKWNWALWVGFGFAIAGLFSYQFFAQFALTRDFPWANLLLFGAAALLLVLGLARAFGNSKTYRGKIIGPIFAGLTLVGFSFFAYIVFYVVKQVPASAGAPRVGEKAAEFALPDQNGRTIGLADLLADRKSVLLIFYRGFW